jgi:hypothetical protein
MTDYLNPSHIHPRYFSNGRELNCDKAFDWFQAAINEKAEREKATTQESLQVPGVGVSETTKPGSENVIKQEPDGIWFNPETGKHKVIYAPTMSREEAAQYLAWMQKLYPGAEIIIEQEEIDAIKVAIAALRGWVRTADRVPEVGQLFLPIARDGNEWAHGSIRKAGEDVATKALDYWIPLPPLPEVDA